MSKNSKTLIIAFLIIFVVLYTISFILQTKKQTKPKIFKKTITPTSNSWQMKNTPISPLTPTLIPPTFTGVFEKEMPEAEASLVKQKQALKTHLPFTDDNFVITFDYEQDKFIVQLKEPKTNSQIKFKEWLKNNYPAIPLDRFILK